MRKSRKKTICVLLGYNCESTLQNVYEAIPKGCCTEIILADDGSTDSTLDVAKKLGIHYITQQNGGYGSNLKQGIQKAIKDGATYIVELHGDGQYDPHAIPAALERMEDGHHLILGSRFSTILQPLRDGMPVIRYLANLLLSTRDRLVLRVPLTEFHSGFRVYHKKLFDRIPLSNLSDDYLFSYEIILCAVYYGFSISEVPVRCYYRRPHSSISLMRSIRYAISTFRLLASFVLARWNIKRGLFRSR